MFVRRLLVERVDASGARHACPIKWIDNFAMRNFTNDAIFDDTLPVGDGLLERDIEFRWIGCKWRWKTGFAARDI